MERELKAAIALTLKRTKLGLTEVKRPLTYGRTCFLTSHSGGLARTLRSYALDECHSVKHVSSQGWGGLYMKYRNSFM